MTVVRKLPANERKYQKYLMRFKGYISVGTISLYSVLTCLAILLGSHSASQTKLFVAGQVATEDTMASQGLVVVDAQATRNLNEQALAMQPLICDINSDAVLTLRKRIQEVLSYLSQASDVELAALSDSLSLEIGEDIGVRGLASLAGREVQESILMNVLPHIEQRLLGGVIADSDLLMRYKGGVLIRHLESGVETLLDNHLNVPDILTFKTEVIARLKNELSLPNLSRRTLGVLVNGFISPTLFANLEETKARNAALLASIEPVYTQIQKGEMIVRQGERVSVEQQQKLQALWKKENHGFNPKLTLGIFAFSAILSSGLFFSPSGRKASSLRERDLLFISTLILFFVVSAKCVSLFGMKPDDVGTVLTPTVLAYAFPLSGAAGLAALIFSTRRYFVTSLLLAFLCSMVAGGTLELFLFYFISCMFNTWLLVRAQNRQDVVWATIPLFIGLLAIWTSTTFLSSEINPNHLAEFVAILIHAILSLLLVFALSPIIEMTFGHTTRFKLMELMNMEQPLIQDLMMSAPGTHHHSIIVANMVEAGAKAIGANSLLCKVAALYHDVGKIAKPEYFIENQFGGENKHDKLTPSMSALVLISHLKRGVDLAQQHKLGQEIVDIIAQHHGTSLIRFFYQKALKLGENPREEDYSYPGPRPQTREAAIVMLADVVEASSRTLSDPTSSRIRGHIDGIVKYLFTEGQLDESDLTLRDIHKLSETFQRILTGLFHQRIEYPDKEKKNTQEKLAQEKIAQEKKSVETKNPELLTISSENLESSSVADSGTSGTGTSGTLSLNADPKDF